MKLLHEVFVDLDNQDKILLERFGIAIDSKRQGTGHIWFRTDDNNPNWPLIRDLCLEHGGRLFTVTSFSSEDIDSVLYLQITAYEKTNHAPNAPHGFRSVCYDASEGCLNCAVGLRQSSDFTPRKPVKWGRDDAIQFSGIWDEVFVKPEVWEQVFKPFGIACRPVRLYKTGEMLPDIVQLVCEEVLDFDLHPTEAYEDCKVCGRRRYDIHNIGFMPCPKEKPRTHLFKSSQWFGTGHNARRQLTITQDLYQAIKAAKLRGVGFRPCGPQMPQWKQPLRGAAAEP